MTIMIIYLLIYDRMVSADYSKLNAVIFPYIFNNHHEFVDFLP